MDKAPDAFRTISEVAADLDVPQHVLRFWETRFTQIKPMKRSGGRRYYRPDDVDLLRGIRRLLYGEGYTIRGVQRILKEHGIKSVQGLVDGSPAPSFGIIEAELRRSLGEANLDDAPGIDADDDDYISAIERDDHDEDDEDGDDHEDETTADFPIAVSREPDVASLWPSAERSVAAKTPAKAPRVDMSRLKAVLDDLVAARQLLDAALRDG